MDAIRWDFPTWAIRARPFDWQRDLPELRSPETHLNFRELGRRVVPDSPGWDVPTAWGLPIITTEAMPRDQIAILGTPEREELDR